MNQSMQELFKVIIAGGREFNNYALLEEKMDFLLQNKTNIEIVSGKAPGADRLGEQYAKKRGYPIKEFPADWNQYGRSAGPRRNKQMAEYANACACFWNGVSKGTADMIKQAKEHGLIRKVIRY